MRNVTVKRDELLAILRKNKDSHRSVFLEAQSKYRDRVIEELDRRLEDAKNGRQINLYFHFPEPEDHTKDYDRVIKMVEMEVEDVITLDENSFTAYVMDDWAWRRNWVANTLSYTQS